MLSTEPVVPWLQAHDDVKHCDGLKARTSIALQGCTTALPVSGDEPLLFLGLCRRFAGRLAKEASERRLPRVAIEGVGGLFEFDTIEQALDVSRDCIGSHDERVSSALGRTAG